MESKVKFWHRPTKIKGGERKLGSGMNNGDVNDEGKTLQKWTSLGEERG